MSTADRMSILFVTIEISKTLQFLCIDIRIFPRF